MSFICGDCKIPTRDRVKPINFISEIRQKLYDNGGHGWETAKEILLCSICSKKEREVLTLNYE